ncbi:MAG: hypothetical protein ABEJ31_05660 [Haloarculaceae archaeon]
MTGRRDDRGQLVLVAAAVLVAALAPVVLAYLQLGYHADVAASDDYDAPVASAERFLERAVHEASVGIPGEYDWADRKAGVAAVRQRLAPRRATLAASRVTSGTAYRTTYNQSAARAWAAANCPDGPDRQFGACEAREGVVVQDRAGRTQILAVALDVRVTTERGRRRVTVTVPSV